MVIKAEDLQNDSFTAGSFPLRPPAQPRALQFQPTGHREQPCPLPPGPQQQVSTLSFPCALHLPFLCLHFCCTKPRLHTTRAAHQLWLAFTSLLPRAPRLRRAARDRRGSQELCRGLYSKEDTTCRDTMHTCTPTQRGTDTRRRGTAEVSGCAKEKSRHSRSLGHQGGGPGEEHWRLVERVFLSLQAPLFSTAFLHSLSSGPSNPTQLREAGARLPPKPPAPPHHVTYQLRLLWPQSHQTGKAEQRWPHRYKTLLSLE